MLHKKSCTLLNQRGFTFLICIIGLLAAFEAPATYDNVNLISKEIRTKISLSASNRIDQWHNLLETAKHLPETEKLEKVNNFFNRRILYVSDINLWGVVDYWATPYETLAKGAGDCEDYSIAKYFTLKKLGISEKKIRITYVTNLKKNQPHMILTYKSSPNEDPVILDNLLPEIAPAKNRTDLAPLYSFNEKGLWIAKFNSNSERLGNSSQLEMWSKLTLRM